MMNRNIDLKKNKTDVSPRNEILVESLEKFVSNYYTASQWGRTIHRIFPFRFLPQKWDKKRKKNIGSILCNVFCGI